MGEKQKGNIQAAEQQTGGQTDGSIEPVSPSLPALIDGV